MGLFHWLVRGAAFRTAARFECPRSPALTPSPAQFRKMCARIFKSVDRDHSNSLSQIEIEVAVYQLYNIINKRLPGWQDPPSRVDIGVRLS